MSVNHVPGRPRRVLQAIAGTGACLLALMLFPVVASAADLQATTSNFGSVFAGAQGGDRILLASGDYGTFTGGSKSSNVTIQPASGASASMAINLDSKTSNITLNGLSIAGWVINGSQNLTIQNSTFTSGLAIIGATRGVVIDHDTFDNLAPATWEGRLSLNQGATGVVVKNSHFGGNGGCSDGVFVGDATGNTIGPGNEFTGIKQGSCSSHDDAIQLYTGPQTTITGNYFHDDSTHIMAPDGGSHNVVTNNVFAVSDYVDTVQLGSQDTTTFSHNTVLGIAIHMDSKVGGTASRNGVIKDNVMDGSWFNTTNGSGCSSCTIDHNLYSSSSGASGSNTIIGKPLYVGPTGTWAGYALAVGSPGKAAASDGTDVGINAGSTSSSPPSSPPPAPAPAPVNTQPVAAYTYSPTSPVTGQAVAFDASSSTCQDSPCTYTWQDDGPDGPGGSQWALGTGQKMSFTFQQTGTKWVRLIVTDVNGDTNSTMQTITVGSPSAPAPAPAPVQNGQLLVGSSTVQNVSDSDSSGTAEAFMATAVNSGTTAKLSVYVNSGNGAKTLVAGIYSDSGGHPGSLLTKGTVSGLTSQAWNTLTVSGASLASGQKYWLAILGTGGTLAFRDAASSSCHSETSASNSLTTLPSSWRTGRTWGSCPVSGYATN